MFPDIHDANMQPKVAWWHTLQMNDKIELNLFGNDDVILAMSLGTFCRDSDIAWFNVSAGLITPPHHKVRLTLEGLS